MNEEPHFRLFKHVCLQDLAEEAYLDEQSMVDSLQIAIQGSGAPFQFARALGD
jgi:hypothetical protein